MAPSSRRRPLLLVTAVLGVAIALTALLARSRDGDARDPGRHLRAVVVTMIGAPSVGEENPSEGSEIPQGKTIRTPTRSGLHLRIGDRIEVAIDRGSRVKVLSLRAGSVRLVTYEGSVRARVRALEPADHFAVEVGGRSLETDAGVLLGTDDRVAVLDGKVAVNPGERGTFDVAAGSTWHENGEVTPIDESDARHLAALVAARPWVLGAPP